MPPPFRDMPQVSLFCPACGATSSSAVSGLVLGRPEGRRFWREQGRVRAWREQEVEAHGRPAYRTVVESVGSSRRLEVFVDRNTLEVIE